MARTPNELAGTRFGPWNVEKRLGAGAMGAVYRATRADDPKQVAALKVLRADLATDEKGRARFVREAKSIERVSSPHCCASLGSGEEEGLQWLALEFVEGQTLEQVLKVRGQLDYDEVVSFIRQVLLGLAAAHEAGVIHRDVKPANVILTPEGIVKLVDFGLARRDDDSMLLTAEGAVMGTPSYMSPEQCGGEPVDHRADLYAVGAMAFHLVTGRTPFQGSSVMAILKKHLDEPVPPLRNFRGDAPAALDRFIGRLMKKKRDDRYPDARAALEALELASPDRRRKSERLPREEAPEAKPAAAPRTPARAAVSGGGAATREAEWTGQLVRLAATAFALLLAAGAARALLRLAGPAGVAVPVAAGAAAGAAAWFLLASLPRRLAGEPPRSAPAGGDAPSVAAAREAARRGDFARAALAFAKLGFEEDAADCHEKAGDVRRAGELHLSGGRFEKAAAAFEKANDVVKAVEAHKRAGSLENAARVLEAAGRMDEAARLLAERAAELEVRREREQMPARLARIDSELAVIVERASKLFQKTGAPAEGARLLARLKRHVEAAELYLEANDRASAVAELLLANERLRAADLHERAGDVIAAARVRADHWLAKKDRRAAATELERAGDFLRAARLFEDEGEVVRAAELHDRGGDKVRAAELFERGGKHFRAGELFERVERTRDAARCFREAGDARREAASLARAGDFFGAGIALLNGGLREEALVEFRRVKPGAAEYEQAQAKLASLGGRAPAKPAAPPPPKTASLPKPPGKPSAAPPPDGPPRRTVGNPSGRLPRPKAAVPPEASAWIGKTVDRYRVVDFLGSGAFAHVFRAEHVHLERPVALKVLRPEYATQPKLVERFLDEAKVVSRIKHPGVVDVYDFGDSGGSSYMALEFVDGGSLRALLSERGALPVREAAALARAVLAAVEAAHRCGVVHRDLKPENVLRDRTGAVKVVDFGMARVFWGVRPPEASGDTTAFAGTPKYAAPEAGRSSEVDARADQYAVGLILYELLTNDFPFRADSPAGWLSQHAHVAPVPPSARRPDLPAELDRAILRSLEKTPAARFADASAFSAALEPFTRA